MIVFNSNSFLKHQSIYCILVSCKYIYTTNRIVKPSLNSALYIKLIKTSKHYEINEIVPRELAPM